MTIMVMRNHNEVEAGIPSITIAIKAVGIDMGGGAVVVLIAVGEIAVDLHRAETDEMAVVVGAVKIDLMLLTFHPVPN